MEEAAKYLSNEGLWRVSLFNIYWFLYLSGFLDTHMRCACSKRQDKYLIMGARHSVLGTMSQLESTRHCLADCLEQEIYFVESLT
jgi:hypothetical protein